MKALNFKFLICIIICANFIKANYKDLGDLNMNLHSLSTIKIVSEKFLVGPYLDGKTLDQILPNDFILKNNLNAKQNAIIAKDKNLNAYQLYTLRQGPFDCTAQALKNALFLTIACESSLSNFTNYYEKLFDQTLYGKLLKFWSEKLSTPKKKIDLKSKCEREIEDAIVDLIRKKEIFDKSERLLPDIAQSVAEKIITDITLYHDQMYGLNIDNYTKFEKKLIDSGINKKDAAKNAEMLVYLEMAKDFNKNNFTNLMKQIKELRSSANYTFAVMLAVPDYSDTTLPIEEAAHVISVTINKVNNVTEFLMSDSMNDSMEESKHKEYKISIENLRELILNQDIEELLKISAS